MAMKVRGQYCIGFASVLSLVSLLLLIILHVGQISTATVPRRLYMVQLNTTGYQNAVFLLTNDNFTDTYTNDSTAPLDQGKGLHPLYRWGLYSHCGFLNDTEVKCSNQTLGHRYEPFQNVIDNLPDRLSRLSNSFIEEPNFKDTKYTGSSSKAAYWMILLGTVCAALAFITGVVKHNYTFCVSTLFAVAGTILLLIGASIWTVIIKRTEAINSAPIILKNAIPNDTSPLPTLGFQVAAGNGLSILWGAFGTLLASVIPYMISCCTWRG